MRQIYLMIRTHIEHFMEYLQYTSLWRYHKIVLIITRLICWNWLETQNDRFSHNAAFTRMRNFTSLRLVSDMYL